MTALPEAQALVERLHRRHPNHDYGTLVNPDGPEAAATIARLQAERDGVREKALREAAAYAKRRFEDDGWNGMIQGAGSSIAAGILALIPEPSVEEDLPS